MTVCFKLDPFFKFVLYRAVKVLEEGNVSMPILFLFKKRICEFKLINKCEPYL